ncbi:VanZ family protein [Acidaminobacter sp. JC074]|uniref:VanZ family protein n=1 Tax=Acidaminobacter sp. JC074 TaxID=2530199 RepID=UPI001F0F4128|nr:VanZ family protein [Acidaminobacter sp. JC074]MCH4889462.1 VanZ family protein [Acidaminobacter sp. JC074]
MRTIDNYVKSITKSLDCSAEEKEDLRLEFIDHLSSLKDEYMIKGYTEKDAIRKAISDFGDEGIISKELNKNISKLQKIMNKGFTVIWWMYLIIISWLLIRPTRAYYNMGIRSYNLEPFKQILIYITRYDHYNFNIWFYNLFGNMILFIPFGFLLPVCFKKGKNLWSNLLLTILFSFSIEGIQYIFAVGIFDIDDIILNTVGGLIGFSIYTLLVYLLKRVNREYLI